MFQAKRGACSVISIRVVADIVKAKPISPAVKEEGEGKQAEVQKAPTEEMFGRRWWQLPGVFAIAGGIAYKMIELAAVSSLVSNGGP